MVRLRVREIFALKRSTRLHVWRSCPCGLGLSAPNDFCHVIDLEREDVIAWAPVGLYISTRAPYCVASTRDLVSVILRTAKKAWRIIKSHFLSLFPTIFSHPIQRHDTLVAWESAGLANSETII